MNSPDVSDTGDQGTEKKKQEPLELPEISEILGLLDFIKAKGGREDIYKLSGELQLELGEVIKVIRGAELLKLVHTPGGDVVLEALGEQLCKSKINQKKAIIKEQIEKIPVFKEIRQYLDQQEDQEVSKDEILEKLAEVIPNENAEQSFTSIVAWGRYGELFGYNDDSQTFYLDDGEEEDEEED